MSKLLTGRKPSANPQRIVLVVVLVIVIETSEVEHDDEDEDEDDLHSGFAKGLPPSCRSAFHLQRASEVCAGIGVVGPEADGLLELANRLVELSLLGEDASKVDIGVGEVWLQADGVLELPGRRV